MNKYFTLSCLGIFVTIGLGYGSSVVVRCLLGSLWLEGLHEMKT